MGICASVAGEVETIAEAGTGILTGGAIFGGAFVVLNAQEKRQAELREEHDKERVGLAQSISEDTEDDSLHGILRSRATRDRAAAAEEGRRGMYSPPPRGDSDLSSAQSRVQRPARKVKGRVPPTLERKRSKSYNELLRLNHEFGCDRRAEYMGDFARLHQVNPQGVKVRV
mmetsp:Transcript_11407/g.27689  ORF Transcript_11407/g.27689 Transcript_11407/m.27689 type:complete len:171 (+) Transcript_11407:199-711(+)